MSKEKTVELTLMEFEEYNKNVSPKKYTISTENKNGDLDKTKLKFELSFGELKGFYNPNTICLVSKDKSSRISFHCVKSVTVKELGGACVYKMKCENFLGNNHDEIYTVMTY